MQYVAYPGMGLQGMQYQCFIVHCEQVSLVYIPSVDHHGILDSVSIDSVKDQLMACIPTHGLHHKPVLHIDIMGNGSNQDVQVK